MHLPHFLFKRFIIYIRILAIQKDVHRKDSAVKFSLKELYKEQWKIMPVMTI